MYGPTVWPWYVLVAVRSVQLLPLLAVRSGRVSPCWSLYRAIWLRSVWTVLRRLWVRASWLAPANCGMTMAARMPRMITTIRISISVKPGLPDFGAFGPLGALGGNGVVDGLTLKMAFIGMLLCVFGVSRDPDGSPDYSGASSGIAWSVPP